MNIIIKCLISGVAVLFFAAFTTYVLNYNPNSFEALILYYCIFNTLKD